MIDHIALRKRIRRLEKLSRGLGIEEERLRTCSSPIMADEREKYREGLRQAIAGVETARLALVLACQRIERRCGVPDASDIRTSSKVFGLLTHGYVGGHSGNGVFP